MLLSRIAGPDPKVLEVEGRADAVSLWLTHSFVGCLELI